MSTAETKMILRMIRVLAESVGWLAAGRKTRAASMTARLSMACELVETKDWSTTAETLLDEAEAIDRGDLPVGRGKA